MPRNRNQLIGARFGQQHQSYEHYAGIQKQVAQRLAAMLPDNINYPFKILEIGCGTGLLTAELLAKYPKASFDITDISPDMLQHCTKKFQGPNKSFFLLDAEDEKNAIWDNDYDLIISAMTLQWLELPLKTLERLRQKSDIYFATIGKDNFAQWYSILSEYDLENRKLNLLEWPGIIDEDRIDVTYKDASEFTTLLRKTGASLPQHALSNEEISRITKTLRHFNNMKNKSMTWHIVYGHMPKS